MQNRGAPFLKSETGYGADLSQRAVSAWRGERPLLPRLIRASWAPTVVGSAAGVLTACLDRSRPKSGYHLAMNGLVGSALGFGAGQATRDRTVSVAV